MYSLNINSLGTYVMMTIWYALTMVFLIDRKLYTKAKAIHHLALLFLILWWILALIFQSLAAKIYGALLIVAVIVIEIRFRKSRAQGQASLHLHS